MTTLAECGITPAAEEFLKQMADVDRYLRAGLKPLTAVLAPYAAQHPERDQ